MDRKSDIKTILICLMAMTLLAVPSSGDIIVYEGFQYTAAGDSLHGQPDDPGGSDTDAVGLAGTWLDATGTSSANMFLKSGSLIFGDLPVNGNHIGFESNSNNDIFNRTLTADAQNTLIASGEIWFSILFEKLQNNFSAGEGGFVFANKVVGNSKLILNDGSDGLAGFGFGPTTAGDDLTPYIWDGSNRIAGDAAISVPPANGSSNTSDSNLGDVRLIVGNISFDTGPGGTDEYTLYDYKLNGQSVADGTLSQVATTMLVDIDQASLNIVNLTRQVNLNYDELRIGTSLGDVLGASEVYAGDAMISWSGQAVALDPDYAEGFTPIAWTWTTNAPAGYIVEWYPGDNVESPTVTITKDADTGDAAVVKVTLTADTGTRLETGSMTIDVYDNSCLAAMSTSTVTYDITDFNQDCVTDLADFVILAQQWLIEYAITEPQPK